MSAEPPYLATSWQRKPCARKRGVSSRSPGPSVAFCSPTSADAAFSGPIRGSLSEHSCRICSRRACSGVGTCHRHGCHASSSDHRRESSHKVKVGIPAAGRRHWRIRSWHVPRRRRALEGWEEAFTGIGRSEPPLSRAAKLGVELRATRFRSSCL